MGDDCTFHFPKTTRIADVEEFLLLLRFQRGEKGTVRGHLRVPYFFYKDEDYRYITGLYSELYYDKDELLLRTRTTVWRSKFDVDFHNLTLKRLRRRFGGYFISDVGRNRYFESKGSTREKAEAGVYRAFNHFDSLITRAQFFLSFIVQQKGKTLEIMGDPQVDSLNPLILSANVLVPLIISAIEDFFRSVYIALLRYSPQRERIVQNAKIHGAEILAIDRGEMTVPEAIAKWMSFQDLNKISSAYKELNAKYDINGTLKRPYGRRRESFWDVLDRLIRQRHALIHRAEMDTEYRPEHLERDIDLIHKAMWRIYQELIRINKWQPVEKWEI